MIYFLHPSKLWCKKECIRQLEETDNRNLHSTRKHNHLILVFK